MKRGANGGGEARRRVGGLGTEDTKEEQRGKEAGGTGSERENGRARWRKIRLKIGLARDRVGASCTSE